MSNRTFSKPLTHAILILFLALLFTAVLLPLTSQDAHAAVIAEESTYTLSDDGTLLIRSNAFTYGGTFDHYGSPAYGKKAIVRKIVFGADVTVITREMAGGRNETDGWYAGRTDYSGYFGNVEEIVIGSNVKSIASCSFQGYYYLEKINIPKSVDSIGQYAFMNCSSLRSLTVPGNVTTIKDYCFAGCTNLRSVTFTGSVNTIGYGAFYLDGSLQTVTLPASVTMIDGAAFQKCSSLKTLTLPANLDTIGSYAFESCTALQKLTIPKGVTTIKEYTFYKCGSLESVTFQGPLSTIEKSAFDSTGLTAVTLPKAVSTVGQYAFANCERLKTITFKGEAPMANLHYEAFENVVATGYYPNVDRINALNDKFYNAYHNSHTGTDGNWYSSNDAKVQWVGTNIPISKCTITGIKASYNYTGKAIKPTVAVKINGTTLRKDIDYTVSYTNNVKAGTATVTIKGKGNYTGSVKKTFKIVKKAASTKLAGANRYGTAQTIADQLKKENGGKKFSTIVVASGDTYPDALAGVYLAKVKSAPIILTSKAAVREDEAIKYVKANLAAGGKVYILGGTGTIPNTFITKLRRAGITNYKRLGGANRYETNLLILREAGAKNQEVIVVTGANFPDALISSATARPLLLVAGNVLTPTQKSWLATARPTRLTIVGDSASVSNAMAGALMDYSSVTRVSGSNIYDRSVKVAQKYFKSSTSCIFLAIGTDYPDALAGGPLAIKMGGPILLTGNSASQYKYAQNYVKSSGINKSVTLGGQVSDSTIKTIMQQ